MRKPTKAQRIALWFTLSHVRAKELDQLKRQADALKATIRCVEAYDRWAKEREVPENVIPMRPLQFKVPSEFSNETIISALAVSGGDTVKAAALLGVKYRSLHMAIISRRIRSACSGSQIPGDAVQSTAQPQSRS